MEIKKYDKVNLERFRGLFFQAGLLIALAFCLILFQWSSAEESEFVPSSFDNIEIEETQIIRTQQNIPPPSLPPPPVLISDIIEIVENTTDLEEELSLNLDFTENEEIELLDFNFSDSDEELVEEVFLIADDLPVFPGGDDALRTFIAQNIIYPEVAVKKKTQGKVYVRFVITSTGEIDEVQVVRGIDPLLDEEAMRVVKTLPKWTPGKNGGKNVSVWYTIPINFSLK